ncbi:homoserine kinase [Synechococcus sp. PCC 7335]|uniref:homoserine kinase n=1 Tax=Synechococcus sp. (strain ATCC 29403 / PCC 7335) TaxID=91464 RepID=UPI00017EB8C2|nr:homoserine kinase [Synechococcus sp. PCC 7335]EDX87086.1 homoserine kinase [Synechococcus sp. PCC 7335]
MPSTVAVTVPATTANIGPGFDCLGAAFTLYNRFHFTPFTPLSDSEPFQITVVGTESKRVNSGASNLVYRSYLKCYERIGISAPPVHIKINLGVPLSRGLGSSSTAIVGGIIGANTLAGSPLTKAEIARLANQIEGHPDNVVPALFGGAQLAVVTRGRLQVCHLTWHETVMPVVIIPEFELSTADARRVLPAQYSRADAIFNTAHIGLLLQGLATGNGDWISGGMSDRIHQPYRKKLIPGYDDVRRAAMKAGAWGLVISGAGPTLLALAPPDAADVVREAMETAWESQPFAAKAYCLKLDTQGAVSEAIG